MFFQALADGVEKSCSTNSLSLSDTITPPASEAGADIGHNDSASDTSGLVCGPPLSLNNTSSRIRRSSDITFDGASYSSKQSSNFSGAVRKGAFEQVTDADTKVAVSNRKGRRGHKRKRDSITNADAVDTIIDYKKPKRSLLSEFLEKRSNEESDNEEEASTSITEKKDEFEVEKIISYDRIKVGVL